MQAQLRRKGQGSGISEGSNEDDVYSKSMVSLLDEPGLNKFTDGLIFEISNLEPVERMGKMKLNLPCRRSERPLRSLIRRCRRQWGQSGRTRLG